MRLALKCDETEAGRSENTLQNVKNYKITRKYQKKLYLCKNNFYTLLGTVSNNRATLAIAKGKNLFFITLNIKGLLGTFFTAVKLQNIFNTKQEGRVFLLDTTSYRTRNLFLIIIK